MSRDSDSKFDAYAESYDELHSASVVASGEGPAYFAEYKVNRLLREGLGREARVLDYGCGIGNVLVPLTQAFEVVHGFDPSPASLEVAGQRAPRAILHERIEDAPSASFDAVVLSGVLHHVPPADRLHVVEQAVTKLAPAGRVFMFEHNPLNPLTRRAVAACPFDDDAILLWPWKARELLERAELVRVSLDYIVFFPRPVAFLRGLEPLLTWLPLGAQVMATGTKGRGGS